MNQMKRAISLLLATIVLTMRATVGLAAPPSIVEPNWLQRFSYDIGQNAYDLFAGCDIDGDGFREFAVCGRNAGQTNLFIFEATGDNSYQLVWQAQRPDDKTFERACMTVGDSDNDGRLEVIAGCSSDISSNNDKVALYEYDPALNGGQLGAVSLGATADNPPITPTVTLEVGSLDGGTNDSDIWAVQAGDLDNDGNNEVIIGSLDAAAHSLVIYEKTGDNTYASPVKVAISGGIQDLAPPADLDGDGSPELAVWSKETALLIYEWDGTAAPTQEGSLFGGSYTNQGHIVLGDIDGNGTPEVIVSDSDSQVVRIVESTAVNTYATDEANGLDINSGNRNDPIVFVNPTGTGSGSLVVGFDVGTNDLQSFIVDHIGAEGAFGASDFSAERVFTDNPEEFESLTFFGETGTLDGDNYVDLIFGMRSCTGGDGEEEIYVVENSPTSEVSDILNDGQGDFDPWNEVRWSYWYESGKIIRPFEIDTSLRFADKSSAWYPDLSALSSDALFIISSVQGIEIDGNGIVIDTRNPAYRDWTLDQHYSGGTSAHTASLGPVDRCFRFAQPLNESQPASQIHHLSLKGFEQSIRMFRDQEHPLIIRDCLFTRNSWGTYFSGTATTSTNCQYFENGRGASYLGSGNHGNYIVTNTYRDNCYIQATSYGDFAIDTAYDCVFEGNNFLPSQASSTHYRRGLSFYRNMGESGKIREDRPHNNIVRNNTFDGYSVAIDIGARMGRSSGNDVSHEGRDHADDNLFVNNTFRNCTIGIRVLTPYNTIEGNTFENVDHDIVMQCVFYNLFGNVINNQAGDDVHFWFVKSDYSSYQSWFPYQDDRNGGISESEKLIQVRSDYGTPTFPSAGSATFINAPTLLIGSDFKDTYATGGTPIDIAVGNFYENHPGDEVAVIWDQPVSNISGTNYYTIIIYDSRGVEIDRSGRSTVRWGAIAAGDFISAKGEEIAVVHSEPVSGKYPVYIFRRGYKDPHHTLMSDNTSEIKSIAAGNFKTDGDDYDEVAVVFESGSTNISYCKPTDTGWSNSTTNIPIRLTDIAAGDFDGNAANGDEVTGILGQASAVYFFRPGGTDSYETAAGNVTTPWTAIGAGNFDGGTDTRDEVAVSNSVATAGIYQVEYFVSGSNTPFKISDQNVLGVQVNSLDGGKLIVGATLSDYERADGFTSSDYGAEIAGWGEHAVVLPSAPQTTSIPLFWLNTNPSPNPSSVSNFTLYVKSFDANEEHSPEEVAAWNSSAISVGISQFASFVFTKASLCTISDYNMLDAQASSLAGGNRFVRAVLSDFKLANKFASKVYVAKKAGPADYVTIPLSDAPAASEKHLRVTPLLR